MKRLRDLREDADLNQMQVAKLLCCTQATYSRYESGELNIPIESLKILASYYNTSIDYITGFTDVKNHINVMIKIQKNKFNFRTYFLYIIFYYS